MEQRVSEALGDYYPFTTSSAGNAGGTTVVSTTFQDFPGGNDDDAFENWYCHITSGTDTGNTRRCGGTTPYAQSTSTLMVSRAYSAQIATSVTGVLHRHDPTDYYRCIGRALEELYPHLYLPIYDETLVVDDRLSNSDFETFSGGSFTSWTLGGAGAADDESTTIVRHGARAAQVTAGGGAAATLSQALTINIDEITGKSLTYKCWVYATAASTARLYVDTGTATYSSYHSGNDQWELLEVVLTVPSTATGVTAGCEVAAGGVGRFDAAWLSITPLHRYTLPSNTLRLHRVYQQTEEQHPERVYAPLTHAVAGRRLRLVGKGLLTRPASDTATTEIGEPQVNLVCEYAAMLMNEVLAGRSAISQRYRYDRDVVYWNEKVNQHLARTKTGGMAAQLDGNWRVEEDSTTRYLVLPVER